MYRFKQLPPAPSLEFLKKEAKDLRRDHRSGDSEALQFIRIHHPRLTGESTIESVAALDFSTQDAQLVIARAYQFDSWPQLVAELDLVPVRHSLDRAICDDDVAAVDEILDEHPHLLTKPVRNRNDGPPLAHAASHGCSSVVESLMRRDPDDVEHAFHRATLVGALDIVESLLAKRPSQLREALRLAIHTPLESLNVEAVTFLLEKGSDPNAPWSNGVLPMDKAIGTLTQDRITIIRALIAAGAEYVDGPEMDIYRDDMDSLRSRVEADPGLIERRSTFRENVEYGGFYRGAPLVRPTLLHICAEFLSLQGTPLLLDLGADVNARCTPDSDGVGDQTPIFHVANQSDEQAISIVKALLESGADVNARATIRVPRQPNGPDADDPILHGVTPLGYLQDFPNSLHHRPHPGIIALLREHGAMA